MVQFDFSTMITLGFVEVLAKSLLTVDLRYQPIWSVDLR